MITGYKKKSLRKPSLKLSGDVPHATWRAVIFSEIVFPVCMAILFVIAYLFVKSFPVDGKLPPSPLIRIAVISLGPVVWNPAVLLTQFLISLFLGPIFQRDNSKFGAVMAFTAHALGMLSMVGFFDFLVDILLFLYSSLPVILTSLTSGSSSDGTPPTPVSVSLLSSPFSGRYKILISVFLSRGFKHDGTNMAGWTGRWYGRHLASHIMSQPAREFVVKIVELSRDLLLGHFSLFILTPLVLAPDFGRSHATILFCLRPSKQIRAPLYSLKQRRQRRAIIIVYGIFYVCVIAVSVALIAIPILRSHLTFEYSLCDNL
ncbi:hypothetical protein NMY22_g17669 [Coprinellus aureogranulatus]|nr:hypothetical protein NMY22_g17669 [Coprinellus aureogranulatus]